MDKNRELALQRISRIGGLTAEESAACAESPMVVSIIVKGKPVGTLTIEAALGAYMPGKENEHDWRNMQDAYIKTSKNPRKQFSNQAAGHHSAHYRKQEEGELSAYDKLDAHRCSGSLLYSYDKNGVHSVLGENSNFGGYHK